MFAERKLKVIARRRRIKKRGLKRFWIGNKKEGKEMKKNKTYIVYPDGAFSWEEIKETVALLKFEGYNPKIVKHNGLWNVQAQSPEASE